MVPTASFGIRFAHRNNRGRSDQICWRSLAIIKARLTMSATVTPAIHWHTEIPALFATKINGNWIREMVTANAVPNESRAAADKMLRRTMKGVR